MKRLVFMSIIAFSMCGCASSKVNSSEVREAVLSPGEEVVFENPNGSGVIKYISERKRFFKFSEGTEGVIKMKVRKQRFRGKLGLYEPASRWFFEVWKGKRVVATEAQMHFDSLEEAQKYMHQGSTIQKWVYNEDGYVVGYFESPQRNQVSVDLYRYYIKGKPAFKMPGYDNSAVVLRDALNGSDEAQKP